ncbi:MAG TPA: hypothetical protein ACFYD3_03535 [Candidatus Hypogeohydataceae bacterium YC41]
MTTVKCSVCLEELEIEEIPEEKTHGCALCGKRVTALMCPLCFSEFNLVEKDVAEVREV